MEIFDMFEKISLPIQYKIKDYRAFLDSIRKRLIKITPEEIVRQKTIVYLQKEIGIPDSCMEIEESLSHYIDGRRERVDILFFFEQDGEQIPLGLVECKSLEMGIYDQTFEQAKNYADALELDYVFLCDGNNMECYYFNNSSNEYRILDKIPTYKEMINKKNIYAKFEPYYYDRTPLSQLKNPKLINTDLLDSYIGEDTPKNIIGNIINLAECFNDTSQDINPDQECKKIVIINKDLQLSYRRYNDLSDGGFGTGYYRLFLTKDLKDNTMIFGISFLTTSKEYNDPKYGNQTGKSILAVSYTGEKKDRQVFQINLNKFLIPIHNGFKIIHNGGFSYKNARIDKLKDFIMRYDRTLLIDDEICLGKFPSNRILCINDGCVQDFIHRLLAYAYIVLLCKIQLREIR